MNYTQLSQAIQDYLETDEPTFVANIPNFVVQAEQRVFNTVQFPSLRRNMTGFVSAGNPYLACPRDFLAAYSLAVVDSNGAYDFLLNKDVNFIRQVYPNPATQGLPRYYALFGPRTANPDELTFIIGPTPDASYTMELHFFYYPESITTAGTSWLGDNFESVLLFGALVEAYVFLKGEPDLVKLYDDKYKEALTMAKRLGDGMERQDAFRSGQVRIPVT